MNKLFKAIKEKSKGNYVSSDTYTFEERLKDMCSINERLRCNMLRVMEIQDDLKVMNAKDVFYSYYNQQRAEMIRLNKQIRKDTLLLEKLMYIS